LSQTVEGSELRRFAQTLQVCSYRRTWSGLTKLRFNNLNDLSAIWLTNYCYILEPSFSRFGKACDMEQVAVIVGGILGATGLLIGISLGATYFVPTLNNISTSWSLVMAMSTVMVVVLIILALWIRNENVSRLRVNQGKTIKRTR
jgi:hypothetical protein